MGTSKEMTHQDKLTWMAVWASKNKVTLNLEGECGFGRECVGIIAETNYPDYEWYDDDYNRVDTNGEVWKPENAYHKHPCVAVLGRGEKAESELYDWLKWFNDNGFTVETGAIPNVRDPISIMLGKHRYYRMVKKIKETDMSNTNKIKSKRANRREDRKKESRRSFARIQRDASVEMFGSDAEFNVALRNIGNK